MPHSDAVAAFLAYAAHDRRRSPHTIARYRAVLTTLAPFGDPLTMDREAVETWWASRFTIADTDTARLGSSRANELACLRAFYRYATKYDLRPDDPTRRLEFPKIDNHVPRPIGESDLTRLLGPLTENAPDLRRAFALGAYAGLRVSEAAELEWANIDTESRRIYTRGKGSKERVVGLSPILLDKLLPVAVGNVVAGGGPARYTGGSLQRKANRLMTANGIGHSFHDLRKRGATLSLARGMNPEAVRQVFGWSSMQTVTHYAMVGSEELDKIAEAMV